MTIFFIEAYKELKDTNAFSQNFVPFQVTGTSQQRILTPASSVPVIHWEQSA